MLVQYKRHFPRASEDVEIAHSGIPARSGKTPDVPELPPVLRCATAVLDHSECPVMARLADAEKITKMSAYEGGADVAACVSEGRLMIRSGLPV
jgi:hypothetical protein